jgi:hypothetical protein
MRPERPETAIEGKTSMSEEVSEWRRGVLAAFKDKRFEQKNSVAMGMATAMRHGRGENDMTYEEGYEIGEEVARRCKYS